MSGAPRFRFRDGSGKEHEVASVEELSRRVEEGRLRSETELFDAGTKRWASAGSVPVFQFIVEELRREGRLPASYDAAPASASDPGPPGSTAVPDRPPHPEPRGGEPSEEALAADLPEEASPKSPPEATPIDPGFGSIEELPLTPDPFEMHLPRSLEPKTPRRPEEAPESAKADPGSEPEAAPPTGREGADDLSLHDWLMSSPRKPERGEEGGDRGEEGRSRSDTDAPSGSGTREAGGAAERPPKVDPWPSDPRRRPPGSEPFEADVGSEVPGVTGTQQDAAPSPSQDREGLAWPGKDAEGPRTIRSRPPPPRRDGRSRTPYRRRERQRGLVIAFLIAGGAVLAVALLLLTGGDPERVGAAAGGDGPRALDPGADLSLPPFPLPAGELPGLDGTDETASATGMEALVAEALEALIDSVRLEAGIAVVPPPGWLGGLYLSSASGFEDVVEFWTGYDAFVRRLADEDEALYLEAARRAWAVARGGGDPVSIPVGDAAFDVYLTDVRQRYQLLEQARNERYLRRSQVADAALELHAFLVGSEAQIEYAPALGRGVSVDPILEAVPVNVETRREMDRHLDRLFAALDQTRRGVPPALGGLRTELFYRLREPV